MCVLPKSPPVGPDPSLLHLLLIQSKGKPSFASGDRKLEVVRLPPPIRCGQLQFFFKLVTPLAGTVVSLPLWLRPPRLTHPTAPLFSAVPSPPPPRPTTFPLRPGVSSPVAQGCCATQSAIPSTVVSCSQLRPLFFHQLVPSTPWIPSLPQFWTFHCPHLCIPLLH